MSIKGLAKKYLPGLLDLRNRIYNDIVHYRFKNKPIEKVFIEIYKKNHWNDEQSISGTGSNDQQTAEIRISVAKIVQELKIKKFLDIPCGDFNWMKNVDLDNCHYFGADIVNELVENNKTNYSNSKRDFFFADLTSSELPKVDLVFCRDCLVHLSYQDIQKAIANLKRSGSTYLLTTTFTDHTNRDIVTGNWRPINLQHFPFSFSKPTQLITEKCTEGDLRYRDKSLGLWKISDLPS